MKPQIPDLDPFIANDRSAVRYYLIFAAGLVAIGIMVIAYSFHPKFVALSALADISQKVGGAFVSTLSAFPLKEYLLRKDRLRVLSALQGIISNMKQTAEPSEIEIERITELVWDIYKKGAVSG